MKPSLKFVTGKEHRRRINDPRSCDFSTSKNRGRNFMKIERLAALICAISAASEAPTSTPRLAGEFGQESSFAAGCCRCETCRPTQA